MSSFLVAAVHYQETGFGEAPKTLAELPAWRRHRDAAAGIPRPARYPNRSRRHPSVKDDFDVVMAIAAALKAGGARDTGPTAKRAVAARYGDNPDGRLATAMVVERARAWRLLGTIPLPGNGELATPVTGVVGGCGYFGCPRPGHLHNGVDYLAPTGTPIHAAGEGVVASVEAPGDSGGYGNFVCIQHRPNLASCYAHMSAFAAGLSAGDHVERGQVIGLVGSTGHSTAPHLHFEVRRGPAQCSACAVDPLPLLSGGVPDAILPHMSAAAPRSRAAITGPAPGVPAQPAAAAPPGDDTSGGAEPEVPTTPARGRSRPARGEPTTGGTVSSEPAPARTTPAPAPPSATTPATPPPAAAAAPQPPGPETGTGGAVPPTDPAPPPTAPPPPAAPPPPPEPTPPPAP